MRNNLRLTAKIKQAKSRNNWDTPEVYPDGDADGTSTPHATGEYGWLVGGTDKDALEVWAESGTRVGAKTDPKSRMQKKT